MKLELKGITKRFGALVANDQIDLVVEPGQIVSLLGENGAGKSTLMNVLYGLYQADAGEILIDDKPVKFKGPGDAMGAGIGMVHQHFMLIPVFTVAENVALGNEPTKAGGVMDLAAARDRVREISERFGFNVDPDALIQDLPVGVQQRVEIIKALSRDAKVLVLDEPTAVLTPQETDELMAIMRQLAEAGTSIIFITHKLREVQAVADRIVVIRLGKVVGEARPTSTASELASMMVGREVQLGTEKAPLKRGEVVLSVVSITVLDDRGQTAVDNLTLQLHAGEVLAIAGVQGNGQTELAEAIVGLRRLEKGSGSIRYKGKSVESMSVRARLEEFLSYVPEDRKKDGLVADFSIEENLMLNQSYEDDRGAAFVKRGLLDLKVLKSETDKAIEQFDIRTQGSKSLAGELSGGNQQKVVLAREMSRPHDVLLVAQPTRGVDVGSIEFIHDQIMYERDKQQTAVLLISTELDEVLALADRIAVMYRGRVVGVVPADTSRETLGKMMAGVAA